MVSTGMEHNSSGFMRPGDPGMNNQTKFLPLKISDLRKN
jgi:hypothetical protein